MKSESINKPSVSSIAIFNDNIDKLILSIKHFFVNQPVNESKDHLWNLYKWWAKDNEAATKRELTNMIVLYDACRILIEEIFALLYWDKQSTYRLLKTTIKNNYMENMDSIDQKNASELTPKDVKDLQYGIGHFFINYPYESLKETMWELYSGWVYESADAVTPQQIRDMLIFYQSWGLFLDDVYQYSQYLERNVLKRSQVDK